MSQENVEVVRRFIDQYGDRVTCKNSPPTSLSLMFPEARPYAWDLYEMEVNKLIPVSDDRVLAHSTIRAEGRESGVKLDGDLYQCVWLRHGRFMRWEDHLSLKGALRALGLSGETLEAAGLRE